MANELNPKLWDNQKLKPAVKSKVLEIVEAFKSNLEVPLSIVDIQIVGSNAAFNYKDTSDLDVHIISNFDNISDSTELLQAYYNAERSSFNRKHDITIYGINVELYVEDIKSTTVSNGIYSIMEDDWVRFPITVRCSVPDIERSILFKWEQKINTAIATKDADVISEVLDRLYLIRKNSLSAQGEYSKGNYLFKEIRAKGWLDNLKDAYTQCTTDRLTLESMRLSEILHLDV